MLEADGDIVPVVDTRTAKGMKEVYGGAYAAGCIYAPVDFAKKNPNTAQAVVNAMVRALRFIQTSTPDQIVAAVPPEYYGATRRSTRRRSRRTSKAIQHDGAISLDAGAQNVLQGAQDVRPERAESDRRPREDVQHDVRAEGGAEVQVMAALAAVATGRRRRSRSTSITCTFAARARRRRALYGGARHDARRRRGEFVSVVGPTGCGKSTLLNVAAGLLAPSAGACTVFGEPLAGINRAAGYMFQADALMPWRSALDNVTAGLEFRGIAQREARERARASGSRASGSPAFGDRYPHQLSGGMRKRVALAQTLILDPQILLMDEPFSALDVQTRQLMENELLELWSRRPQVGACSSPTISRRRSRCPIASSCCRRGRRRTRSASSRSTCRGRATSPRSA